MTSQSPNYWINNSPQDLFDSMDTNKDGILSRLELKRALQANEVPISERLLDSIFAACDLNNDGSISKNEFCRFTEEQNKNLSEVFKKIDYDGCGYLTVDEIQRVILNLDPSYSDFNLKKMISVLDKDKDGKVTFCEFMNFYHMIPIQNIKMTFDFFEKAGIDIGESITIPNEQDDQTTPKRYITLTKPSPTIPKNLTHFSNQKIQQNCRYFRRRRSRRGCFPNNNCTCRSS
jgi:Ca2+-binding EF-hand superfamily protein